MHQVKYHLANEEATKKFGVTLGERIESPLCILLIGDLGAGKTTLSKCIAKGIGVDEIITSPTFSILNTYLSGRHTLHHFDLYRLEDEIELEQIGFYEYARTGISLVEWADKFINEMPRKHIVCKITVAEDGGRDLILSSKQYDELFLRKLGGE